MKPLLLSLILALALVLAWQWRAWPPPEPNRSAPAPAPAPAAPSDALSPVQQDPDLTNADLFPERLPGDYLSVIERPLFQPERRPPPDEPESEPEPEEEFVELGPVDLVAIMIAAPHSPTAWLQAADLGPKAERFRLGDEFKGWRISAIEPHWVELERQDRTERLLLHDFSGPPEQPQPRPSSSRR